jgi:hypothetical protein
MMSIQAGEAFLKYLSSGVLGRFSPIQTIQESMDACKSIQEGQWDDWWSPIGQQGFTYGRLFICAEPSKDYWDRPANRMGVNFWTSQRTVLLNEIPWYAELEKMTRDEVYAALRALGVEFWERVKHPEHGSPNCEQIAIGQVPMTILGFHDQPEVPHNITWFRDGLDESDYPYRIELRLPKV